MKQLQQWIDEAKTAGIRKAFITFHYPTFARSGMGPIPTPRQSAQGDRGLREGHGSRRI